MDVIELLENIESGEDSKTQFKEIFTSPDALENVTVDFHNEIETNQFRVVFAREQSR